MGRLDWLFRPSSVAVVGASADPRKWGHLLARALVDGGYPGDVHLVNPRGGQILGRRAVRHVADLPAGVDLAVVALPASDSSRAVLGCAERGVRGVVVVAAGFGETGQEGARLQRELVQTVRAAGGRLVGPNCLGVYSATARLNVTPFGLRPGPVGFITQSGNLGLELHRLATERGLGFSRFVSCGNQADLGVDEYVEALADDEETRAITVYLEGTPRGRDLVSAAARASARKPVIVLKAGGSRAGRRSALSHTGSMAGDGRVWDGALRQAGAVTASSPAELLTLAEAAIGQPRAPGPRVAILADGGGHATMAADAAEAAGLSVMELSPSVRRALSPYLLPHSSSRNPVDFAGAAEADLWSFVRCAEVLLSADEVDGLLLAGQFGGYYDVFPAEAQLEERVAAALPPLPARFAKPMVVHTIYANAPSAAVRVLRGGGVPVVEEIRTATAALASLVARERPGGLQPGPALARARPAGARGGRPRQVPVEEATATLSARHVPVVPMIPARSELEAEHAARCVGFPVAVKGVAAGLVHKTDAGAVILGCHDEASVRAAFGQVTTAARRADPADPDPHAVVCPMVGGVEAIVGASRDPTFGPVVMFGLGGVFAEVLGDASFRVAPVDRTIAMAMIRELRAFPVLAGTRGTAVDLEAAARIIVEISRLITDDPNLVELDLNPVFLGPAGAHVADVRLLVAGNAEPERHPQDSATRRA